MANPLAPRITSGGASFGLLVLRLVVGLALCFDGWGKVQSMTDWMASMPEPMRNAIPEFARAGWAQAFAAIAEFGGGIALAAGLLTPLAALAIVGTLGMAAYTHFAVGHSFTGSPSFELPLTYTAAAVCILFCGPGKMSLDGMVFKKD